MPELQVLNGSLQWKTIPLAGERFLIGRKDTCHLILKDGWVSREHTLIIAPKPDEFRVQDLDSENGTFLNGDRIRDAVLKHGDVLRVGRTEMRFTQHAGMTPRLPSPEVAVAEPEAPSQGARTEAEGAGLLLRNGPQTLKVDVYRTNADSSARSDAPRIDLRERVRLLEERLLEGEQANAALAAENAVLKRALARLGVLDRETGAIDPNRLASQPFGPVPESMLSWVTNPLSRIAFPELLGKPTADRRGWSNPGLFDLGLVGVDLLGIRFAECMSRLGYRRAAGITAERDAMKGGVIDPGWRINVDRPRTARGSAAPGPDKSIAAALPRIEEVFGEAFRDCDRVLICADAASVVTADGLAVLADVVKRSGSSAGCVLFFDRTDDKVDSQARALAALAAARRLAESGRIAPLLLVDLARARQLAGAAAASEPPAVMLDSLAGVLDSINRLPAIPASGSTVDAKAITAKLLAKGWSTIGLAATKDGSRQAIDAAIGRALGAGLMAQAMPSSRARFVFVATVVGAELAPDVELEPAQATLAKLVPQAQCIETVHHDAGDSVRVITWVGGLPFPESFFSEKGSGA